MKPIWVFEGNISGKSGDRVSFTCTVCSKDSYCYRIKLLGQKPDDSDCPEVENERHGS